MKRYLLPAIFQRVTVPVIGRVPVNVGALAAFGVMGFDNPAFWAAGAVWETVWLAGTAGRTAYRRRLDARARDAARRPLAEARLHLYGRLSRNAKARHFALRSRLEAEGADPDDTTAPAGLFAAIHLRLLAAREGIAVEDAPALRASALLDVPDPEASAFAERALTLASSPALPAAGSADRSAEIDRCLDRLERLESGAPDPPAAGRAAGCPAPAPPLENATFPAEKMSKDDDR